MVSGEVMANSGYRIVSYVRFGENDATPAMILAALQSIKCEVFVLVHSCQKLLIPALDADGPMPMVARRCKKALNFRPT